MQIQNMDQIDDLGGIEIYTDNKKLATNVNKRSLRYTDIAQEGGCIIKEIRNIK